MVCALRHFRPILLGTKFTVYSDHKPLKHWLQRPVINERHARWMTSTFGLDFDIEYVAGVDNVLADLLSRPPGVKRSTLGEFNKEVQCHAVSLASFADELREATTDEFLQTLDMLHDAVVIRDGLAYYARDRQYRVIVPPCLRNRILEAAHSPSHDGRRKTYNQLRMRYFWPGMPGDIADFINRCDRCQAAKPLTARKRPAAKFPKTSRFETVHIDIVGPLPRSSRGYQYLVTMMDRFTGWFDAIPMRSTPTGAQCAEVLYNHWFSRFGLPNLRVKCLMSYWLLPA